MRERNFKLNIEGPGAEERAKELSDFIEKEFGSRPIWQANKGEQEKELTITRSAEFLAVTAIVLSVPAAILAAMDLVDRIKKKKKTDSLIEWAKKHPGPITIITPDGTAIHLHNADSGTLLDAAALRGDEG